MSIINQRVMQKFCHNCGKQMVVGAKFCPYCGTSLSSLSATPTSSTPATPAAKPQGQFAPFAVGRDDDDDEDNYIDKLQHVDIRQSELHVDIVKDRPIGETVGSVMSQPIRPESIEKSERPAQNQNAEDFKKSFQQEAGTLRHENK